MSVSYVALYVLLCIVVGLLGRGRLIGFIGFTLLALLIHPAVALAVLVLTAPVTWGRREPDAVKYRPLREGEKRPFWPLRRRAEPEEPG